VGRIGNRFRVVLAGGWWLLLLRGLLAIGFGLTIWRIPEITLQVLITLFGAYSIVEGLLGVWLAIPGRGVDSEWAVLLVWGLLGVAFGLLTIMTPGLTALALVAYIGLSSVLAGITQIVAAVRLRKEIEGEWLLVSTGAASILFGCALILFPAASALALPDALGAYALVIGVLLALLALRVRAAPLRAGTA
jgi:uncharacterized membrane protein HdeD (DUF308 family)